MAVTLRGIVAVLFACLLTLPLVAQEKTPSPDGQTAPPLVSSDVQRMLELGQYLLFQNNPALAPAGVKVEPLADLQARNAAGEQALHTFRSVVTKFPQQAQGWLWLGIALTSTKTYTKEHPEGECKPTEAQQREGLEAFRAAYERGPTDLSCVSFYGDALIEFRRDFIAARKLWDAFLPHAKDDIQRVTALTQAGRACLNKAYFDKKNNAPAEQVRAQYQEAATYVQRAARLVPKAPCVLEMQGILQQYRKYLTSK